MQIGLAPVVSTKVNGVITGNLSVNQQNPILSYPTGYPGISSSTPQSFPLFVNGSSYTYSGINDYINITLTDSTSTDHLRSIVGLSSKGGVAIYSGNNDQKGAGIRLNAWNSTPLSGGGGTGYPSGSVQTISTFEPPSGGVPPLSFENLVFVPAGGSVSTAFYNHVFQISQVGTGIIGNNISLSSMPAGDVFDVQDQIGLWDASDFNSRSINGNTNHSALYLNADIDKYSGARAEMYGSGFSPSGFSTQGGFLFTTIGQDPWHVFANYPTVMAAANSMEVISSKCVTMGNNVTPLLSAGDVLTVLDNIGFYDPVDATTRSLNGNTTTGEMALHAHRTLADGSTMELFGSGYATTPSLAGGFRFTNTGSGLASGWSAFANYTAGSIVNNMIVGNGKTTIGTAIDPTNAFYNDVLTVKNAMGFYNPNWTTGPFTNALNGNADKGTFQISANNFSAPTQSSNIQLNGNNCGAPSGTIQHFATVDGVSGTNTFGHLFYINPGAFAYTPILGISNQGNVTIGNGVATTWMSPGDLLTVQQQMGFWAHTDGSARALDGNTNTGMLQLNAHSNVTNGSQIQLYGQGNATYHGAVRYITPGTTGESGMFQSFDGSSYHNSLDIWNNGQVAVGRDMDVSVANPYDQLTVLKMIGMYSPGDGSEVLLNGNTLLQKLQIGSGRGPYNGSALEMYGMSASSFTGAIKYTSAGTAGESAIFQNYDAPGTTTGAFHTNMDIWNNGHVTIGHDLDVSMANPADVLTVYGQMGFYNTTGATNNINGNEETGVFVVNGNTSSSNGPAMEMYGRDFPASGGENRAGSVHFWSYSDAPPDPTHPQYGWMYGNYDLTNTWLYQAGITKDGKMIIGHNLLTGDASVYTPGNYSLYVENGIMTEHVRVAVHTTLDWSDNVFSEDNEMMTLPKLEKYIQKNKHLPEIPSADDVVKDGVDVGEMDAKLLKKIEELTLYVIELQKEVTKLQQQTNTK